MTTIKRLYIELALCKSAYNTCDPRPPARLKRMQYEIVTRVHDIENLTFSSNQNPTAFYRDLNIPEDRKHLLHIVSILLSELVEEVVSLDRHSISNSYAYFAFTDEQERAVFSSPYVTSSLLFNPNEAYSTYALVDARRIPKFGRHKKEFPFAPINSNVFKKTDRSILQLEERQGMPSALQDSVYVGGITRQAVVNSLFDYYENRNSGFNNITELKSVYGETKTSGAFLPDIHSISTYELKVFSYIPDKPY